MQRQQLERAHCEALLTRVMGGKHVSLKTFHLQSLGEHLGFMGDHHILTITFQDGLAEREKRFFVKQAPQNEDHYKYVVGEGLFAKETEMYEKLIPMFCKNLNVSKLDVPACYYICQNNFIIFEDLTALGYKMHDKLVPLDLAHCELLMKTLAKFHAGSFATEYKTGKLMTELAEHHYEVLITVQNQTSRSWHDASLNTIYELLKFRVEYVLRLNKNWSKVHDKLTSAWDECTSLVSSPSRKYKNVLCHGDLWLNNILFKYDDAGSPSSAKLLDFQIFRYCPPALDLVMFLHVTTTRTFREQHLLHLLLTYHEELNSTLTRAGVEPQLSLDELLASVAEYRPFGVTVATRYIPTCLRSKEDIEKAKQRLRSRRHDAGNTASPDYLIERAALLVQGMQDNEPFKQRVTEAVDELLDMLQL